MNAKLFLLGALLIGFAGGGMFASQSAHAQSVACWGGYHADRMGNCQPNNPIPDSRCQAGMIAQVSPSAEGYRCIPQPTGY